MPIKVTAALIKDYAQKYIKYKGYDDSVKLYEALRVHADGDMPKDVIEERRPSESERIKEYREKIYVPITEATLSKVITSLSKIRRSQDWSINYDADKVPGRIADNETLEQYCEKGYPYFKSVTNWAFSVLLKNQIIDANAVEVIWPLNINKTAENEYYKPFSTIFNSDLVLDYSMEDYGVFLSTDTNTYTLDGITRTDGKIIYIVDTVAVYKYKQVALDGAMQEEFVWAHSLGFAPMRKLGGVFFKAMDNIFLYKSRIQSMVPRLDEAARIYSDLQAEIVQHVHSDKWIYVNTECRHCNGSGKLQLRDQDPCSCNQCDGRGYVQTSPYSNLVLTPPNSVQGQQSIPTPPAGYIQKTDVALMVDKIDAQVEKQLYGALSAVNMEFLAKVPLAESGVAKAYDGEETNNFVHSVAEDIVAAIDWTYKVINEYRYRDIVPNKTEREAMLPSIPVPEKFDLLSSTLLLDDLEKANQNKLNPVILNEMQIEYASKKFYNDPKVKDELETIFQLDPFPNITEDEKMVRLSNGGITKEDYVVSSNIQQFVRRAMEESEDFDTMEMQDRKKVITAYAQQVIKANSIKEQIMGSVDGGNEDAPQQADQIAQLT
jgi:hypothetical protein